MTKIMHWCSVLTPRGMIEDYLPKFTSDLEPEDHEAYMELHKLAGKYGTKVMESDHPRKYTHD